MKTRVGTFSNLFFSVVFSLGLASCNKDDFYQKEYLDNPFQDPTTTGTVDNGGNGGLDSGSEGGTQGGVDTGVDGGTTGGTTGTSPSDDGSSAGGATDGGSTGGSSTGGTDDGSSAGGATDGGSTGGSSTGGTDDGSSAGGATDGGSTGGSSTGGTDDGSSAGGATDGGSTGGSSGNYGDCNQGHGNDADGVDESNPTIGTDPRCKREKFKQTTNQTKKLDILWVIDNSGSMADEQDALGVNFRAFIEDFISTDVDFKMAITTTDTSSQSKKGHMVYGSDMKLNSAAAQNNPVQFMEDFRRMVKVGTSGSGYEKGLEATEGFMNKYAKSFLRQDAYLAVVIVSDEEDQSANSVDNYTDYLKSFKNEDGLIKVYSIVDVGMTNNGGYGVSTGYKRYADASKNTAGIVADIRDDFHKSLSDMGDSIINLLDSFALANDPVDGTLKVFVNGVETTDYTYDSASRSIKFDSAHLPPVGADITVTYVKQ